MSHYQHILIAADFSNHNKLVCEKAREIAERNQATLSICHIVEDYPITDFAYEPMISVDIDMRDALLDSGKKQIAELAKNIAIPTANQWVEFGSPNHDIVRLSEEN